jgi:very-short-patch-repair endonuclease
MSKGAVEHRLAMRRLRRIHAGVYAVGQQSLRPRARHFGALLACGDEAALCRWSSAAVFDLCPWPATVRVVVPGRNTRRLKGVVVHATRSLDEDDITIRDGLRCTTVARTIVDLATMASKTQLERLLEQAVRLDVFDARAVGDRVARSSGHRGMALLRNLLVELPGEAPPVASDLERRFYALVRHGGLPLPVVNGHIGGYQVDFHWPTQRLVVETDGRAHHGGAIAFTRDRRRDLDLELAGWHVLRFSWGQVVQEPARVVELLRAYLIRE